MIESGESSVIVTNPAGPAPTARRHRSHAQSPIESESTTGEGAVPFTCEDATPEVVRPGVAGGRTPYRSPERTG